VLEIERDPNRNNETFSVLTIRSDSYIEIPDPEFLSLLSDCQNIGRWPTKQKIRHFSPEYTSHRKPAKSDSTSKISGDDPVDPDMGARIFKALIRIKLLSHES
jgi:hypothetical protein